MVNSPIPLYHVITNVVQQRIEDGDYPVGSAMPTESEFADEFRVSRATVRQAFWDLVQAGLVERRRGSGTYVLPVAHERLGQRFRGSLADLMYETQRTGVAEVEVSHATDLPARIAETLELKDPVGTVVNRIRTMDEQPFAYTVNFLPDDYGRHLRVDELWSHSLMALLERGGVRLVGARQSLKPQLASPVLSESLRLPYVGAPVLYVERLVWTYDESPVEIAQTWYREDMYEYVVTFELESGLREGGIDKFA